MFPLPTFFCRRGDLKRLSYKELFRPRHRMQHLPVLVNHAQFQRGGRGGENGEARLGTAEDGALHGLHLAAEGAGGVGDVVYRAARYADVLEMRMCWKLWMWPLMYMATLLWRRRMLSTRRCMSWRSMSSFDVSA